MQARDVAEQKQNRSSHSETRTATASVRHAIAACFGQMLIVIRR